MLHRTIRPPSRIAPGVRHVPAVQRTVRRRDASVRGHGRTGQPPGAGQRRSRVRPAAVGHRGSRQRDLRLPWRSRRSPRFRFPQDAVAEGRAGRPREPRARHRHRPGSIRPQPKDPRCDHRTGQVAVRSRRPRRAGRRRDDRQERHQAGGRQVRFRFLSSTFRLSPATPPGGTGKPGSVPAGFFLFWPRERFALHQSRPARERTRARPSHSASRRPSNARTFR